MSPINMPTLKAQKRRHQIARIRNLIDKVHVIDNENSRRELAQTLAHPRGVFLISFLNAQAINIAWENEDFAALLAGADVLLRDGVGCELLMKLCGMPSGFNMNGTDFIPAIVQSAIQRNRKLALWGTRKPYNENAAEALRRQGALVCSVASGFLTTDDYILAGRCLPDDTLVILGMGMPKQEQVAAQLQSALGNTRRITIINGGAILDFLGKRRPRAPAAVRALRMEWLFRLAMEPIRLADRYLRGGFLFLVRSYRIWLRLREERRDNQRAPRSN